MALSWLSLARQDEALDNLLPTQLRTDRSDEWNTAEDFSGAENMWVPNR